MVQCLAGAAEPDPAPRCAAAAAVRQVPGLHSGRLQPRCARVVSCHPEAPRLRREPVQDSAADATEDATVFRVATERRYLEERAYAAVQRGPGHEARRWLSQCDPAVAAQVKDTWGRREETGAKGPVASGLLRPPAARAGAFLQALSGRPAKGQRWYLEPVRRAEPWAVQWHKRDPSETWADYADRISSQATDQGVVRGSSSLGTRRQGPTADAAPKRQLWRVAGVPSVWIAADVLAATVAAGLDEAEVLSRRPARRAAVWTIQAAAAPGVDYVEVEKAGCAILLTLLKGGPKRRHVLSELRRARRRHPPPKP